MPRLKAARGRPPVDGEMSGRGTGQAREEVAKCRGSDAETNRRGGRRPRDPRRGFERVGPRLQPLTVLFNSLCRFVSRCRLRTHHCFRFDSFDGDGNFTGFASFLSAFTSIVQIQTLQPCREKSYWHSVCHLLQKRFQLPAKWPQDGGTDTWLGGVMANPGEVSVPLVTSHGADSQNHALSAFNFMKSGASTHAEERMRF